MNTDDRVEQARLLYEQPVFGGDTDAIGTADRQLDAAEADLALARGRIAHARFLDDGHEDPQELSLFDAQPNSTGPWETCAARRRPRSGSAVSIRSYETTTPPQCPRSNSPIERPCEPATP